jgi:hypothetical protein
VRAAARCALISIILCLNVIIAEFWFQGIELGFVLGNEQSESFSICAPEDVLKARKALEQYNLTFIVQSGEIFVANRFIENAIAWRCEYGSSYDDIHGIDANPISIGYIKWERIDSYVTFCQKMRYYYSCPAQVDELIRYLRVAVAAFISFYEGSASNIQSSSFHTDIRIDGTLGCSGLLGCNHLETLSIFSRSLICFFRDSECVKGVFVLNGSRSIRFIDSVISGVDEPVSLTGSDRSKNDSGDKQPNRNFLSKGMAFILGLILYVCGLKSISYSVDHREVKFVWLAFLLQASGVATALYGRGYFDPFPH